MLGVITELISASGAVYHLEFNMPISWMFYARFRFHIHLSIMTYIAPEMKYDIEHITTIRNSHCWIWKSSWIDSQSTQALSSSAQQPAYTPHRQQETALGRLVRLRRRQGVVSLRSKCGIRQHAAEASTEHAVRRGWCVFLSGGRPCLRVVPTGGGWLGELLRRGIREW